MNFFFCSEHYEPRIGGVTTYINEICESLVQLGHQISLGVPGEFDIGSVAIEERKIGFNIIKFGTGLDSLKRNIPPKVRVKFSEDIESYLKQDRRYEEYDVVHCLFGLYFMKYFSLNFLKEAKIPVGVTVHNIPPEECGLSWRGDKLLSYGRDVIRKELVRFVNKRRIKHSNFDVYVVPSEIVKTKLEEIIGDSNIIVIGHGGNDKKKFRIQKSDTKLRFLTVGGIVPHKNQHIIPEICSELRTRGLEDIAWDIVGPIRNNNYSLYVKRLIDEYEVGSSVRIHESVSNELLEQFYSRSSLYIQLSSEEGFCLTVLDAARYGVPIIGTRAGAIPEIIKHSMGSVVELNGGSVANEIINWVERLTCLTEDTIYQSIQRTETIYSWRESGKAMLEVYSERKK